MSRRPAHRKWGIRTLWFLGLAAASIIVSNWMRMTGNTDVLLLTFIGLLVGLVELPSPPSRVPRLGWPAPRRGAPPDRRQRP